MAHPMSEVVSRPCMVAFEGRRRIDGLIMRRYLSLDAYFTLLHGHVVHRTPLHSINRKVGKACFSTIYGGFTLGKRSVIAG